MPVVSDTAALNIKGIQDAQFPLSGVFLAGRKELKLAEHRLELISVRNGM